MRSMNGGKRVASRTGIRSAPVKKRAPAKKVQSRARTANNRGFKRRSDFADSMLGRWLENAKERVAVIRPFTALTVALISAVVIYGLVIGGHVAMAAHEVASQGNRLLAVAGFRIDEVTVTGRSHADKDDLLAALGVVREDPIFGFDTEAARQRLERVDWVKSATVTRLLPDAIRVDLVERSPYAIWQRGGTLSIVDRDGHTITDDNLQSYASLPFVVGFGGARALEEIYGLMQQTQPQLLSRVRAFVRVGNRRWNLRLENGVDLKLPEVGIEQALASAASLDRENRIFSRDIAAVDFRLPDRVTVTLTPEAVAMRDGDMTPVSAEARTALSDGKISNAAPVTNAIPASYATVGGNT